MNNKSNITRNKKKIYHNRITHYEKFQTKLQIQSDRISSVRAIVFLFVGLSYFGLRNSPSLLIAYGVPALFGFFFLAMVRVYGKQALLITKLNALIAINQEGLLRLENKWSEFSFTGEEFLDEASPHLSDLHIFGKNSLFQMLHACASQKGTEQLKNWLSECSDFSIIPRRQEAVKEMAQYISFRQHLLMEGRLIGKHLDPQQFLSWIKSPSFLLNKKWLVVLRRSMLSITALLIVLSLLTEMSPYWMIGILIQAIIFFLTLGKCRTSYMPALSRESHFKAYGRMFELLERFKFKSSYLANLHKKLETDGLTVSRQMKRLEGINHALCQCYSSIYPLLNILFLWDIHYLYQLELWKEEMSSSIEVFFNVLGKMEALSSLSGFAYDNPGYVYPLIREKASPLSAENLGHPLIPYSERVCNNFRISEEGFLALITGSNMSGKSTFLRSIGINTVLAFSGAPVAASEFIVRPCKIMTCIQVTDSLRLHTSHFYAEVKEIKKILDAIYPDGSTDEHCPILYLIDEIFSGTNTKERLIASRNIAIQFTKSRSYGLLTTHDLDLVSLEDESSLIKNFNFMDGIDGNGKMVFDYKIKDGPVTTTNALKVLELAGIKVRG
ncbi:MutS-related protein, family 1 [hydrothermal vent metagenome]|uniref:MutS-related protein, family 1 n=1 Tax=hydrothermal vent metagenome TaxID=652676 RepID=A0A3B1CJE8_9ZZZZ